MRGVFKQKNCFCPEFLREGSSHMIICIQVELLLVIIQGKIIYQLVSGCMEKRYQSTIHRYSRGLKP